MGCEVQCRGLVNHTLNKALLDKRPLWRKGLQAQRGIFYQCKGLHRHFSYFLKVLMDRIALGFRGLRVLSYKLSPALSASLNAEILGALRQCHLNSCNTDKTRTSCNPHFNYMSFDVTCALKNLPWTIWEDGILNPPATKSAFCGFHALFRVTSTNNTVALTFPLENLEDVYSAGAVDFNRISTQFPECFVPSCLRCSRLP